MIGSKSKPYTLGADRHQIRFQYLNAKDEAEGVDENRPEAGRLAQRQQDAETALRQAVGR